MGCIDKLFVVSLGITLTLNITTLGLKIQFKIFRSFNLRQKEMENI